MGGGLIVVIGQAIIRNAIPIARGLSNIEKPAFNWAYRGVRLQRLKKPIYEGYKYGTYIGIAGKGILDCALSQSPITETGDESQTRKQLDFSRAKRQYSTKRRTDKRCRVPSNRFRRRYR